MKLTDRIIAGLVVPEGKEEALFKDDAMPGFSIRMRKGSSSKRYYIQCRLRSGKQHREPIGDTRQINLEQARKIASTKFAEIRLGADPAAEKAKARAADTAAQFTLAVASERYLAAKKERLSPSYFRASQRHLGVHFAALAHRPLGEIKRAEVAAVLERIASEYGNFAVDHARSTLSALYGWAMGLGLVEHNPVLHTNKACAGIQSRERVLTDKEVVQVWNAAGDDRFGKIVRLLILTGCRRDEIGGLRWSEVDLDAGTITIAAERSKNRRSHCLVLPQMALDILASIPRQGDFVFGRRAGFNVYSHSTEALRHRLPATMPEWTLHDIRRTFRTGLGALGVLPHVAELAINHAKKGLIAVYDKGRYQRDITQALALWSAHVQALIDGRASKVVTLKRA